jgi:predicted nucleic acid-binding protein
MMIADTDVLIDFLAGQGPGANRIALELELGALQSTVITRFELLAGVRSKRQQKMVRQLLDLITWLPLDLQAADKAAEIRMQLEQKGESIGMADSLIAGIALTHRGVLITRNHRHFSRVPGLILSTWEV